MAQIAKLVTITLMVAVSRGLRRNAAHVRQALEILTGMPAGEPDAKGEYPEETLLGVARKKARDFWLKSLQKPPGETGG